MNATNLGYFIIGITLLGLMLDTNGSKRAATACYVAAGAAVLPAAVIVWCLL